MTIKELRSKRIAAEIPATLLAARAGVNRSRLSGIERGYIQPIDEEMTRLQSSLEDLLRAKAVIQRAAASVGWPLGAAE
jgi:predicted transcriptional regulator